MTVPSTLEATAACGAFLLVAYADGRFVTIEEARFLGGVVDHPAFRTIEASALVGEYNRLNRTLASDYDAGETEILAAIAAIAAIAGVGNAVEAVKVAARHAIIADQALKPQEDLVLARIARALGVSPDDL